MNTSFSALNCPVLEMHTNMDVNSSDTHVGTHIQIQCHLGYMLDAGVTSDVLSCGNDSRWSGLYLEDDCSRKLCYSGQTIL